METSSEDARIAAERVIEQFAARTIEHDGVSIRVTTSAGTSCCEDGTSRLDDLFARADRALYAAKQAGRNRVVVADAAPYRTSFVN